METFIYYYIYISNTLLILTPFIVWFIIYRKKFNQLIKMWKTNWNINSSIMFLELFTTQIIFLFTFYISTIILRIIFISLWFDINLIDMLMILALIPSAIIYYFSMKFFINKHKKIIDEKLVWKLASKITNWFIYSILILLFLGIIVMFQIFSY